MKNGLKTIVLALAAISFVAARSVAADAPALAAKGDKLYTQFSLFYEKGIHRTTNYRIGTFVPINTEVTFVKAKGDEIEVTLPDGTDLKVVNIEKYSGEKLPGIFNRTFAKTKVDLSKFTKKEKSAIEAGEVEVGMSKDAVIASLGYPPKHQTPTLKGNQWRYWRNVFANFLVHFEDDKVTSVDH